MAKLVEQVAVIRRASAPVLSAVLKAIQLKDAVIQGVMQSEGDKTCLEQQTNFKSEQPVGHKLVNGLAALALVVAPLAGELLQRLVLPLPATGCPQLQSMCLRESCSCHWL